MKEPKPGDRCELFMEPGKWIVKGLDLNGELMVQQFREKEK